MDLELGGRVVVVVGGAGLIGRAVVARLRAEGATAIVASRSAGSELAASRSAGSERAVSERAVSERAVSERAGSQQGVSGVGGLRSAASQGAVSQPALPGSAGSWAAVSRPAVSQQAVSGSAGSSSGDLRPEDDEIRLDARDPESVTAAFELVLRRHGRLDGLVVTAAPSARTLNAARHADPEQVLDAIDAKAMSFLRLANAALPVMSRAGYGRIVGISGQNAFLTGNVTGSIRNAALILAAKNLADSVAGTGITVNTVSPGIVSDTPATEVEPGRPGQSSPEQIADLVAFLASPRAATISGESIAIGHRVHGVTSM